MMSNKQMTENKLKKEKIQIQNSFIGRVNDVAGHAKFCKNLNQKKKLSL